MGNGNQKENLFDAVNADDIAQVTQLVKQTKPPIDLNAPISEENKTTPLGRASWRGNVEMIYTLIELGADVNYIGPHDISPLQWAAQRGKDEAVDYLIQKGAKIDFISWDRLNALDYSILYGSYNTAWKFLNLGLQPKDTEFYKAMAKEKHILFYDYEKMVDHLNRKIPLEECPPFNIPPPEVGFKDPVIDPRETWGSFFKRVMDFEEPPLVERSDLPPELRPENRTLGKLRSLINGFSPYPEDGASSTNIEKYESRDDIPEEVKEEQKEHVVEMKAVDINIEEKIRSDSSRKESDDVSSSNLIKVVELNPTTVHYVEQAENKENQGVA